LSKAEEIKENTDLLKHRKKEKLIGKGKKKDGQGQKERGSTEEVLGVETKQKPLGKWCPKKM